ncbi:MAG: hypothetical protein QOG91_300 [Candidatus Parcubacteria bacterium]|nr:hypothetical protein [Candidatus Parcubacteria bacterium]
MINLKDTSDDGCEILGCIEEATLQGTNLTVITGETRIRFERDEYEPHDENNFSDSVEGVEDLRTENDGTISFSPWCGYDSVRILPREP